MNENLVHRDENIRIAVSFASVGIQRKIINEEKATEQTKEENVDDLSNKQYK